MSKTWLKSRVQRRARLFLWQLLNTRKALRTFDTQETRQMATLTVPLIPVPFLGATIFVSNEVEPRVPMRPIVEALGLVWGAQQQKLRTSEKRWGVSIIDTPSAGGIQGMLAIPLRRLFGWLNGLTVSRVKKELRPTLEQYQQECDRVLELHWSRVRQGLPTPPPAGAEPFGNMLETIYGTPRAACDPEAERLARIALDAKAQAKPLRSIVAAAEAKIAALGYKRSEVKALLCKVEEDIKAEKAPPQLALEG